jgi:multidrug efflux pump subunit AcrB
LANVQLPDGASLQRTPKVLERVTDIARKTPGVDQVVTIAGVSPLDNNTTLASGGAAYIILKDWSERGKAQNLFALFTGLNKALGEIDEANILVLPPPIQGVGNAGGFNMQIELRDGSLDLGRVFQIYVQADLQFRLRTEDIQSLTVRNKNGDMIPLGTLLTITPTVGPSMISLYNLYPSAGANARASIGITVFTGIASTCLAVLFVPAFFVLVQRFEEWRAARKRESAASLPAEGGPCTRIWPPGAAGLMPGCSGFSFDLR